MGYYKYLKKLWKQPKENFGREVWRDFLVELRRQPAIFRVEKPTRIDRARNLGYKAKQGFIVVRSRVTKGLRKIPEQKGGRRPKRYAHYRTSRKSAQVRAEEHVARKYPNCEVLNSYWIAEDGIYKWYEVILVDKDHPAIKTDKNVSWLAKPKSKRRVFRGLTSAGRKSRGLVRGGRKGTIKRRPSKRSKGQK